jgi:hypothetical protein
MRRWCGACAAGRDEAHLTERLAIRDEGFQPGNADI